jgi:hypothetical protein
VPTTLPETELSDHEDAYSPVPRTDVKNAVTLAFIVIV